jgi:hypothetical protein
MKRALLAKISFDENRNHFTVSGPSDEEFFTVIGQEELAKIGINDSAIPKSGKRDHVSNSCCST